MVHPLNLPRSLLAGWHDLMNCELENQTTARQGTQPFNCCVGRPEIAATASFPAHFVARSLTLIAELVKRNHPGISSSLAKTAGFLPETGLPVTIDAASKGAKHHPGQPHHAAQKNFSWRIKKPLVAGPGAVLDSVKVVRAGLEPATPAFSGPCSTN